MGNKFSTAKKPVAKQSVKRPVRLSQPQLKSTPRPVPISQPLSEFTSQQFYPTEKKLYLIDKDCSFGLILSLAINTLAIKYRFSEYPHKQILKMLPYCSTDSKNERENCWNYLSDIALGKIAINHDLLCVILKICTSKNIIDHKKLMILQQPYSLGVKEHVDHKPNQPAFR